MLNFDTKPKCERAVEMFPDILRAGIFGPSGGGKTNILLTILLHIRSFKNVYLCSKTGFQEKYSLLRNLIVSYNKRKRGLIKFHTLSFPLPKPETIEKNSVVIFDDVLTENQDMIADYFMRGRHRGISCFFLSQCYTKIAKKSGIRGNFNYLIILRQDLINLRQIYVEYITGIHFDKFKNMCEMCWADAYGFLVIDVDNDACKYRKNFEKCL